MKKVLVIAPHPDDETLGAGGTILKLSASGAEVYWLIVTEQKKKYGISKKIIEKRKKEILKVSNLFKFKKTFQLKLPANRLDTISLDVLIKKIKKICDQVKPELIFLPFEKDIHTDHFNVSRATQACIKSFRNPYIKKALAYEIISETNFNFMKGEKFKAQTFFDISKFLKMKIKICEIYKSEISKHPFPRSILSIKSLAKLRGSQSGFKAAEAFQLLFEKI